MTARLECYIRSCARNGLFGCAYGSNFSMRFAGALVPTFGNDAIVFGDDASNPRIWMRCFEATFGERKSPRHRESVKFSEHYVTRKRSSLTIPLLCYTPTSDTPVPPQRNTSLFGRAKPPRALKLLVLGDDREATCSLCLCPQPGYQPVTTATGPD